MSNARSQFFLGLLGKEQQANLRQVRQHLEVPCPQPTDREIEEAADAECRERLSDQPLGCP